MSDQSAAKAAFDARWQQALDQPEVIEHNEDKLTVEVAATSMLDRLRRIAGQCRSEGLITAEQETTVTSAADGIGQVFATVDAGRLSEITNGLD